jgi:nicotinamidase/pyrazinamidase
MTYRIDRKSDALIIVDIQKDFCPGGALGIKNGDDIIPLVNSLQGCFSTVVFSRDWHPADHCSFSANPAFIDKSWPTHCVAHSPGAHFHDDLSIPDGSIIISKGEFRDREEYSAFQNPRLQRTLSELNIERLFICGLATDYCVKSTSLDALQAGYKVCVILEAVRGVDVPPGTVEQALKKIAAAGAILVHQNELT